MSRRFRLAGFGAFSFVVSLAAILGSIALAPLVWLPWGLWWSSFVPGLAVPEVLSSLGSLAWLTRLGVRLRRSSVS